MRCKKIARFIFQLISHQAQNLVRIILRQPVNHPPLGSVTLDMDNVKVAQQWLKDRTKWDNHSIVSDYERRFAEWNGSRYAYAFLIAAPRPCHGAGWLAWLYPHPFS
jgi:hypothetical protein